SFSRDWSSDVCSSDLRAGPRAVPAQDAPVVVDKDDAVLTLVAGPRRAGAHTGGVLAVHAAVRQEVALDVGELTKRPDLVNLDPVDAHRQAVLLLAGHYTGVAADTPLQVNQQGWASHSYTSSVGVQVYTLSGFSPFGGPSAL